MTRQRELEALMVKAGPSTGGQIASSMAYRPEYNQLRGEMVQLRKAAMTRTAGLPRCCRARSRCFGSAAQSPERTDHSVKAELFSYMELVRVEPRRTVA